MKKILSSIKKLDETYNLIEPSDKIAIAVSGGKDSLLLASALSKYRMYSKKDFKLISITIDLGFENFDLTNVTKYLSDLRIEHIIQKTQIAQIVFDIRKEKNPCSLCSKMRKGVLYETAKAQGCNKVALGHHLDDAIDTFYLSLFYERRFFTIKPKIYLSRADIWAIRPLLYANESEVISCVKNYRLPVVKSPCVMDKTSNREKIRELIKDMPIDIKPPTAKALIDNDFLQ